MFEHLSRFWEEHGSSVLTGTSVVCMIAAPILSAVAQHYAEKQLDILEKEQGKGLTTEEKIKAVGLYYVPATVAAVGGIACGVTSHGMDMADKAALMAGSAAIAASFNKYVKAVESEVTVEQQVQIEQKFKEDTLVGHPKVTVKTDKDDIHSFIYETPFHTFKVWEMSLTDFWKRVYNFSNNYNDWQWGSHSGEASLRDFFEELGVKLSDEEKKLFDEYGWSIDDGASYGYDTIKVSEPIPFLDDAGHEFLEINFVFEPNRGFLDY